MVSLVFRRVYCSFENGFIELVEEVGEEGF